MAKMLLRFNSLYDFQKAFPTELSCIRFLENKRWPNGVVSPYDPSSKIYKYKQVGRYTCKNTGKDFNVRTGTIFQDTKIPLRKWFLVIFLVTTCPKGVSAYKIQKDIGVCYKTAWFLLHRIRESFVYTGDKLTGEVELDETFVGGHNNRRHWDRKCTYSGGRSHQDKKPVMGLLERDPDGGGRKVICEVIENTSSDYLTPTTKKYVALGTTIYKDDWQGYNEIEKLYNCYTVDHGHGQYVNGNAHTNTIEGFWGNYCKRSFYGCYNWVKGAHMHRYFNEFAFRYNTKKDSCREKFSTFFDKIGHYLPYKQLINEYKYRNLVPIYETSAKQRVARTARLAAKQAAQNAANTAWSATSTSQGISFSYSFA